MSRGTVRWFDDGKGYGFIQDDRGQDVFVHYSVIEMSGRKSLQDGQEVDYDAADGPKGLHATKVVPVGPVGGALNRCPRCGR